MQTRGRPVLGGFAGFLFGIFLDGFLLFRSTFAVGSIAVVILPIAGLVLGAVWGRLAPLGRRESEPG